MKAQNEKSQRESGTGAIKPLSMPKVIESDDNSKNNNLNLNSSSSEDEEGSSKPQKSQPGDKKEETKTVSEYKDPSVPGDAQSNKGIDEINMLSPS